MKCYASYTLCNLSPANLSREKLLSKKIFNTFCNNYMFQEGTMDALYASVANVLKSTLSKKTSLRTAVYANNCETLKYKTYLEKVLNSQNVMKHIIKCEKLEQDRGVQVADRHVKRAVQAAYRDILDEHRCMEESGVDASQLAAESPVVLPRYVRVNTLKMPTEKAMQMLIDDGFEFLADLKIKSRSKFRKAVDELGESQFFRDRHVPDLLVFHPSVDLHELASVCDFTLILQDKASCLPAFVLQSPAGSVALDACAAPGNKTSHLAAVMQNQGKIYAFDRDQKRLNTLQERVAHCGASIVVAQSEDFLKLQTEEYSDVEYVVLDPPCSGTGMVKRGQFLTEEVDERRVRGLANLQTMLLKHALKLPSLKRLVYSTCSVQVDENEGVVEEALKEEWVTDKFELVDPLPNWKSRGKPEFDFASQCLRADPQQDLTNGFFVALFQRKP